MYNNIVSEVFGIGAADLFERELTVYHKIVPRIRYSTITMGFDCIVVKVEESFSPYLWSELIAIIDFHQNLTFFSLRI